MKKSLKLGDKVKALVTKTEIQNVLGKVTCKKGSIYRVCDIGDDYVMVDNALIEEDNTNDGVVALANNEFELIKE